MQPPVEARSSRSAPPRLLAQPSASARETVAIAGSCLTRDNFNRRFNPRHHEHYEVRATSNQAAMVALMSPPIEADVEPLRSMNDYDRWNVAADLSRAFLADLVEAQPDLLVLDFQGDVRFGVARLPDGRFVTDHHWKTRQTEWYAARAAAGELQVITWQSDPEVYFALWTEAMDRFAAFVAEHCPRTHVVVHRGHHAGTIVVPGRARPLPLGRHERFRGFDVDGADAWWARLDDHAVSAYGWDQIDLRDVAPPTYDAHPWGAFFGHFTPDYYHRFLAELTAISLRRRHGQEVADRVDLVARAAAEPWQRRLEVERAVVRRREAALAAARARVAELEGLGLLAGLRWVAGQALRRRRAPTGR